MSDSKVGKQFTTSLGLLAILLWSTNIAFSRTVMEHLGALTAGAAIYLLAGLSGCCYLWSSGQLAAVLRLPRRYLWICGTFFVTNMVSFYLAVGLARGRQQVLEVGLINYLWPSFTLLASVPILRKKPNFFLLPGMVMAFAGIFLAATQNETFSWAMLLENCRANTLPYAMALVAALAWGLYSCYNRALGSDVEGGAISLFLLAAGTILLLIRVFRPEPSVWAVRPLCELVYVALLPTFLAYTCWDISMRKGNVVLVVAFSYSTPLLSTIISCVHLAVPLTLNLAIACILVIAGALVCKLSLRE
jgi:drug/metabolite transporter (DMT)-like permease